MKSIMFKSLHYAVCYCRRKYYWYPKLWNNYGALFLPIKLSLLIVFAAFFGISSLLLFLISLLIAWSFPLLFAIAYKSLKCFKYIAVAIVERAKTILGAIEKRLPLLSQYWKNSHFDGVSKIISHFGGTNNMFVDYMLVLCSNSINQG